MSEKGSAGLKWGWALFIFNLLAWFGRIVGSLEFPVCQWEVSAIRCSASIFGESLGANLLIFIALIIGAVVWKRGNNRKGKVLFISSSIVLIISLIAYIIFSIP